MKLSDRDAEEAIVAAFLLHDDFAGLEEARDEDYFYDDIRPIVSTVRMLRGKNQPCGTVFVLAVSWHGKDGKVSGPVTCQRPGPRHRR